MNVWGVLVASASPRVAGTGDALRAHLEGLVVVSDGQQGSSAPSRLDYLLHGLRSVPTEARIITLVDDAALALQGVEAISAMLERLTDGLAGVVRAEPVTDALKRVQGERVLGAVDRTGLFMPATPQVLRRDALDAALLASRGTPPGDPATLLVRGGHSIGVLWGTGAEAQPRLSSAGGDR